LLLDAMFSITVNGNVGAKFYYTLKIGALNSSFNWISSVWHHTSRILFI